MSLGRHLETCGDNFDCHNWSGSTTDASWIEDRDSAKHLTTHYTETPKKNHIAKKPTVLICTWQQKESYFPFKNLRVYIQEDNLILSTLK